MTSISEQIRSRPDFNYNTKVYYKKYTWRVSFYQPGWRDNNRMALQDAWYRNRKIEEYLSLHCASYKTRADTSFFVYISEPSIIPQLLDQWGEDVIEILGPVSEKHQDILLNDLQVVTRKRLWYNKYRYKISCTRYGQSEHEIFEEMQNFCLDTLESDTYKLNDTFRITSPRYQAKMKSLFANSPFNRFSFGMPYTATGSIYLVNHDDVISVHLTFKPYITTTHKVITLDEL